MNRSTYVGEVKEVLGKEGKTYGKEEVKNSRNGLETLGRFRMGNKAKASEYWRREEEKLCRACKEELETTRHVLMDCVITGRSSLDWKRQLKGDRVSICRLNEIKWKRRREEIRRQTGQDGTIGGP